jgi:arginine/ornithine N-succinyltransferase beta subunit
MPVSHLMSNQSLDFRACLGPVSIRSESRLSISAEVAAALRVGIGDALFVFRIVNFRGRSILFY